MSSKSRATRRPPVAGLTNRLNIIGVPILVILGLFAVSASSGADIQDRGILPIVRFLGLLSLAMAIFSTIVVSTRCVHSYTRWGVGQAAAVLMGFGAGYLWSATSYGLGFTFFMIGVLLIVALFVKELERRGQRRNPIR